VRLGLEDYDYAGYGPISNAAIVARAVDALVATGHQVATVDTARRLLAL